MEKKRNAGAVISALKGSRNMMALSLAGCTLSDDDVKLISALPNLQVLCLSRTAISDRSLRHLVGNKKLRDLDLTENKDITPASAQYTNQLPRLAPLGIDIDRWPEAELTKLKKRVAYIFKREQKKAPDFVHLTDLVKYQ